MQKTESQNVLQVSQVNSQVKRLLEASYGNIWIEGEISNLARPASGHLYFTLKDQSAQIRCALFRQHAARLRISPENGLKVKVRGSLSLYEARGDYQLIATAMEPAGLGDLQQAFDKLKQKLAAEGLYDEAHKKPIPAMPHRIGVITSPHAAAVRDIIVTCKRRFPLTPLLIYPSQVQGEQAAAQLCAMIKQANTDKRCDVLILARGGGSLEDLWPFNEESLARAVYASKLPIVTGVGHEIDTSIVDYIADLSAPTPTGAAEICTPDQRVILHNIEKNQEKITQHNIELISKYQQAIDIAQRQLGSPKKNLLSYQKDIRYLQQSFQVNARHRLMKSNQKRVLSEHRLLMSHPNKRIERFNARYHQLAIRLQQNRLSHLNQHQQSLAGHFKRLAELINNRIKNNNNTLSTTIKQLNQVSPAATLKRGYAYVTNDKGQLIKTTKALKKNKSVLLHMSDDNIDIVVKP